MHARRSSSICDPLSESYPPPPPLSLFPFAGQILDTPLGCGSVVSTHARTDTVTGQDWISRLRDGRYGSDLEVKHALQGGVLTCWATTEIRSPIPSRCLNNKHTISARYTQDEISAKVLTERWTIV